MTLDWKVLVMLLGLSGVGGGAGTKAALLGYPPPEQIVTKEYMVDFVKRDELLSELRSIQSQLATMNASIQVANSKLERIR